MPRFIFPSRATRTPSRTPVIFTLTPYISDSYHARGAYFASHGYAFALVDVRGRGNSAGEFEPFANEARDGHDMVEWFAKQPFCDGKVAMWGGSYAGFDQWATAKELPPHLTTIVPAAAAHPGLDFPFTNNVGIPYDMQWFTHTSGRASQQNLFADSKFWRTKFLEAYKQYIPFKNLDSVIGNPSANFQRVIATSHGRRLLRRHGADRASSSPKSLFQFSPSPANMTATKLARWLTIATISPPPPLKHRRNIF